MTEVQLSLGDRDSAGKSAAVTELRWITVQTNPRHYPF
jgi:hypothetical protein